MAIELEDRGGGVFAAPGARIIDRSGHRRLPIGDDGFVTAMQNGTLVDKTMLVADVLDSSYKATLFCRPRRFGKTLNMTMLKAFLEAPEAGGLSREEAEALFCGTEVWEADGGAYRRYLGAYPVVHVSFNTVKKTSWADSLAEIRRLVASEYAHHAYLQGSPVLTQPDSALYDRIVDGVASDADFAGSLAALCRMLRAYHGTGVVVLVDEYDAPVMAGHTNGYYDQVVSFLKGWLTGALKDGGAALAFACLTGVQRISKESVFSDLNNLVVSTALNTDFDERYGFTDAEVEALATYLGHPDCMPEAREWYDGYRFGRVDVYNPWSVLNYLRQGCEADIYWANTSSNSVVGELVGTADADTLESVYALLEPGGTVEEPLDLGIVFPELGVRGDAIWSMLYLAGYLTTEDTWRPNDDMLPRELRIPNLEIARVFRNEVLRRFVGQAGGRGRLGVLHGALVAGDEAVFGEELGRIARDSMSYLDLTGEQPCHALLMGLLFGVRGYRDPTSNREAGYGRYDIRLEPDPAARARDVRGPRPLVTLEVKFSRDAGEAELTALAREALVQIAARGYDADLPATADGRLRWGAAFSGKRVAVACEHDEAH